MTRRAELSIPHNFKVTEEVIEEDVEVEQEDLFYLSPPVDFLDWQREERYDQLAKLCNVPRELAEKVDTFPGKYKYITPNGEIHEAEFLSTELYFVNGGTEKPPFGLSRFFAREHRLVQQGLAVSNEGWSGLESLGVMRTELTEKGPKFEILPSYLLREPINDFNRIRNELRRRYQ